MNHMSGIHPELAATIDRLPVPALDRLVRELILATADQFADVQGVSTYHGRLLNGEALSSGESAHFEGMHADFEQKEAQAEETGSEAESNAFFRKGCYAYALSVAAQPGPMNPKRVGTVLYDMGHAMMDPESFWDDAF